MRTFIAMAGTGPVGGAKDGRAASWVSAYWFQLICILGALVAVKTAGLSSAERQLVLSNALVSWDHKVRFTTPIIILFC